MPRKRLFPLTAYPELRTGNAAVSPEDLKRVAYGVPPYQDQNRTRYGRSLTLDRIENALRGAQHGYMRDLCDMARETMSLDPHLTSVLSKRINAVASLPWEVRPAEGPGVDKERANSYAEFVREQVSLIPSFVQAIKQLAWGLFDGRSALEIQWVNREQVSSDGTRGQWRAAELTWIHPRRLQFGPERELRISDDAVSYSFAPLGVALRDFRCKFVEFKPQLFGDYPELEGLAPRCLYWAFFKRFGARERMILVELFGKPWRIVTVDAESDAGAQDLANAATIADQLGGVSTAQMPRGTKLDVVPVDPGAGEIHKEIIAESDKQISKLVLGQTGTTDAMPGALGGGTQAMVMKDEQLLIAQGDAHLLSDAIEDYLTDAIIELNFGTQALLHAPRFVLRADSPTDRKADTERMKLALELGLALPVDQAYEMTGFRKPEAGDAVIRMVDMPNGMGGNVRVASISISPTEIDEAGRAIDEAGAEIGKGLPPAPAPTTPAADGEEVLDIELGVDDMGVIFTVNEGRKSQGAGPLKLPDGSNDPDGFLTISEFKAKRIAKSETIGAGEGEMQNPAPPKPAAPAPGAVPALPAKPSAPAAKSAAEVVGEVLGLKVPETKEEAEAASDALLSRIYEEMRGSSLTAHSSECRKLALEKNRQPDTVHGSLENLIDRGVREGARVTGKWADTFVAAVRGQTSPAKVQRILQQTADRLDLLPFSRSIERRLVHSAMTGALDSQWEDQSGEVVAPEEFSEPDGPHNAKASRVKLAAVVEVSPSFTEMAYQNALAYFRGKKPVPKSVFEKLNSAAKARSFTVAGLASDHALNIAQSELGNAIVNGTPMTDFASKLAARFEAAGFTPLNASHVETVFRTNVLDSYNVGRKAEMSTPDALLLRPYWVIRTVKDDRQRETHGAVDGWILRATDPFWKGVKGPPWGFNCRCRLSTIRASKIGDKVVRSGAEIRGLPDKGFEPGALWSEA